MSERLVANARPDAGRFALIVLQLALLLVAFRAYHVEGPVFFVVSAVAFAGFVLHYWAPVRFKEPLFVLISAVGAFLVLEPLVATLVLGTGVVIYGVTR
ncbi:MAG: hypothetical protein HKN12_06720, partial [Gemmatimonadetes bacterium]|nr:hypothetical protein [Gemmatimonadota bacterium]